MQDLPNEIRLHIFSFLPLKSLIIGRSVSQEWRRLILLADITSIRRALLDFYLTLVNSPIFPQTRPWVLANLKDFDRQRYIDDLMGQHPYVPEAFRVWILEWPAKAVIGCVWPGLPNVDCRWEAADNVHRIEGTNWLAPLPPTVCAMPFQNYTADAQFIPALFIFHDQPATTWLMLDERESLRGKVYTLDDGGHQLYDEEGADSEWDVIDDDWIGWQKRTWGKIEAAAEERALKNLPILQLADMPPDRESSDLPFCTKGFRRHQLQAHPWRQRDDPTVRQELYGENDRHKQDWGEILTDDRSTLATARCYTENNVYSLVVLRA